MHKSKMKNLYIPPELIELILLRLPVVSLIRFKCVCKSWFSLISDPQFGISHFNLASISPPSRRLLLKSTEVLVQSFDMDFGLVHLTLPPSSRPLVIPYDLYLLYAHKRDHWILGSCRGLVVLNYQAKCNDLIIWNPSTGVYKRFPLDASHDLSKSDTSFGYDKGYAFAFGGFGYDKRFLYGFGYDAAEDDYLLVIIHLTDDVRFFSFKTNTWNTVDGVDVEYMNDDPEFQSGTLLNGALHWLVSCELVHDDLEDLVFVIIGFDLTQRTLSEIHLFNDFAKNKYQIYGLRECRGCLTLCCSDLSTEMTEIWMMRQEDEFLATWSRAMVIPNFIRFCPLFMTIDDQIFGSNVTQNLELEKREPNRELVTSRRFIYDQRFKCPNLQSAMYTESLLPPPGVIGGGR